MQNITVTVSTHSVHKDLTLIAVKGFIDTNTAPEFERTFQTVLGQNKYNLIVDLKDVNYISSVGWGMFIGEIKRIRGQKGNLFLANMSPEVEEAYQLLELHSIIKAFSSVELAIQNGFGRAFSGKGFEKHQAAGKAPAKSRGKKGAQPIPVPLPVMPQAEPVLERPVQPTYQAPPMPTRRKPGLLEKILLPWNWF